MSARREMPRCRGCEARAEEIAALREQNHRLIDLVAASRAPQALDQVAAWGEAARDSAAAEDEKPEGAICTQEELLEAFHEIHGRGVFSKTIQDELDEAKGSA